MSAAKLAILVLVACSATTVARAEAACPFTHPVKATSLKASLVQGYVGCRTYLDSCCAEANAETEGGIPSCFPAETFDENSGARPAGWHFGPEGRGATTVAVKGGETTLTVSLSGIQNGSGAATGTGHVGLVVRATLADPASGAMTAIDYPIGFDLPMAGGKAKLKTSMLASPTLQDLSGPCVSFEVVAPPWVVDPLGSIFATVGLYLP